MSADFPLSGSPQPATDTGQCEESFGGHIDTASRGKANRPEAPRNESFLDDRTCHLETPQILQKRTSFDLIEADHRQRRCPRLSVFERLRSHHAPAESPESVGSVAHQEPED